MDANHCGAVIGNVYVDIWRGEVTMEAARTIETAVAELLENQPNGIGIVGLSRPTARTVPAPEVRSFLADLYRRHGAKVRGIASAIEGDSFIAATKRTAMASIAMLARQPAPLKIVATSTEAVEWLAPRLGDEGATAALLAALHELETRYATEYPD